MHIQTGKLCSILAIAFLQCMQQDRRNTMYGPQLTAYCNSSVLPDMHVGPQHTSFHLHAAAADNCDEACVICWLQGLACCNEHALWFISTCCVISSLMLLFEKQAVDWGLVSACI